MQHGINEAVSFVTDTIKDVFEGVDGHGLTNVAYCQLLNESVCEMQVIDIFSFCNILMEGTPFFII